MGKYDAYPVVGDDEAQGFFEEIASKVQFERERAYGRSSAEFDLKQASKPNPARTALSFAVAGPLGGAADMAGFAPDWRAAAVQGGTAVLGTGARLASYSPQVQVLAPGISKSLDTFADEMARMGGDYSQAAEKRRGGVVGEVANAARSAYATVPQMLIAGRGGAAGPIALGMAQTASETITEGKDAGLKGVELAKYVAIQTAIEGGITAAMQKIGLGGAESAAATRSIKAGVNQALKRFGLQLFGEEVEEIGIALGQEATRAAFTGKPGNYGKAAYTAARDTIATMGAVAGPQVVGSALASKEAVVAAAQQSAQNGKSLSPLIGKPNPSRADWAAAGLKPGANAEQRTEFAAALADMVATGEFNPQRPDLPALKPDASAPRARDPKMEFAAQEALQEEPIERSKVGQLQEWLRQSDPAHPQRTAIEQLFEEEVSRLTSQEIEQPVQQPERQPQQPSPEFGLSQDWQEIPEGVSPPQGSGVEVYQPPQGQPIVRRAAGPTIQERLAARRAELEAMPRGELNQAASRFGGLRGWSKQKLIDTALKGEEAEIARSVQPIEQQIARGLERAAFRTGVPGAEQFIPAPPKGSVRAQPVPVPPVEAETQTAAPVEQAAPATQQAAKQAVPEAAPIPFDEPAVKLPLVKGRRPVTKETVATVFPGAKITSKPNGWHVEVGQSFVDVDVVPDIPIDRPTLERQMGRTVTDEEFKKLAAAGKFTFRTDDGKQHSGLGIIQLSEGLANDETLRHEALHLARKGGLLTADEWNKLQSTYGKAEWNDAQNEEAVARSREAWKNEQSVWGKIKSWLTRLLDKFGITKATARDIHNLLDESGFWQRQGQKPTAEQFQAGQMQVVARPDLANPATDQQSRDLVDVVDADRNRRGQPETRPDEEVQAEADARLQADYAGERSRLLETASKGEMLSDTETLIAKSIVNRDAVQAIMSGDKQDLMDAVSLIDSYRRTGTEQGRAFRQRRDPVESPDQRMQRLLSEAILSPPERTRAKIAKAQSEGNSDETRRLNKEWVDKFEALKTKLKSLGVDLDKLSQLGYSPVRAAQILGTIQIAKADWSDKMFEYWRNAILSSPRTQAANLLGNFGHAAWHFTAERLVEAGINQVAGRSEGAQLGELPYVYGAMLPGISRAARNFMVTFQTELPQFDRQLGREGQFKYDSPNIAIGGKTGRIVRLPQRLLLAVDDFAKTLFANMEVASSAYRIAKQEGLEGEGMRQRMASLTADLESEAWDSAYTSAQELTFQQRGGKLTNAAKRALLSVRRDVPYNLAGYVIPFVTTPLNIMETAVKKSPLGSLALANKMYSNYKAGKPIFQGATAQAAQQVLAWGVVAALMSNDDDDPWITGAESSHHRGKRELALRTRPPQSIKIGDRWYSYSRIEPFATTLASVVDWVRAVRTKDAGTGAETMLGSVIGQLKDKTFLQGISDILTAAEADSKTEGFGRWASSFAVSWVPNLARTSGRAADESMQQRGVWGDGKDWWAMLAQRTAQRSEVVPGVDSQPIYDLWGREIPASQSYIPQTDWLYRMTAPVDNRQEDIFLGDRIMLNWNNQNPDDPKYGLPPQKSYQKGGKRFYMTDKQYADFTKLAGELTSKAVEASKWNTDEPTEGDMKRLETVIENARKMAKARVLSKNP